MTSVEPLLQTAPKCLAWAVHKGHFSLEEALELCSDTCPLNIGLREVSINDKPSWWPAPSPSDGVIDTIPGEIWESLEKTWQERSDLFKDSSVGRINGRVYEDTYVACDLSIISAIQVCRGSEEPSPKDVYSALSDVELTYLNGSTIDLKLLLEPAEAVSMPLVDWEIVPLTFKFWPLHTAGWQYNRIMRGIDLFLPLGVEENVSAQPVNGSLECSIGERVYASWNDWPTGFVEQLVANLPPPFGTTLTLDNDWVSDLLTRNKANYIWVCRLDYYHRKTHYETFESHSEYRVLGAQSIVSS